METTSKEENTSKEITLKVEGMHCPSCETLIKDILEEEGVDFASAVYKKNEVIVRFDEKKVTLGKIKELIKEAGYKVAK